MLAVSRGQLDQPALAEWLERLGVEAQWQRARG